MKVAVIGGGSTYTPELVNGLLACSARLPLTELCLMDTDAARLDVVGRFAARMTAAQGDPFRIAMTVNRAEAIRGAAYVITQLRVGMMAARRDDEYLGHRHGLIGQETTGIGGLAKALRTIPVILEIAGEIADAAPSALLVNFTNPSGLVTEALSRHASQVLSVGLCNSAITAKMTMLAQLERSRGEKIDSRRARLDTLGLNHLTWHRGFTLDHEEQWPELFSAYLERLRNAESPTWDVGMIESLGMIPNSYLQYFYLTDRKLAEQQHWPPSRAEEVMAIEKDLLEEYADENLTAPPKKLMKRGGAYYSTLATEVMCAHFGDLGEVQVVNLPHGGAVREWPADWVLEMPARVDGEGFHPLPAAPLPDDCLALVSRVKKYELLAVEAAVHGDRDALLEAMLAHPLGPAASHAQTVLRDLLESNRRWLPQFFGRSAAAAR